jgi:DNA-directed RNA polymerase specialized sigma24 family protein
MASSAHAPSRERTESLDTSGEAVDAGSPPVAAAADKDVADQQAPADKLFAAARALIIREVMESRTEAEIAEALGIQPGQAKAWLKRLVDEGAIEKSTRPVRYTARDRELFD